MKQCTGMALLGLFAMSGAAEGASVYVGMIETHSAREYSDITGEKVSRSVDHVRLAFVKDATSWQPINVAHYPSQRMNWHVAFDGRSLGRIETSAPENGVASSGATRYSIDIATPVEKVPHVKLDGRKFWTTSGELQSWPLPAVSQPNTRDPDRWKPARLSASESSLVLREYRKLVPKMRLCDGAESQIALVDYKDEDVKIVHAYRAKDGRVIVGTQLPDSTGCGMFADELFYSYWYVLETDGTIWLFGDEMTPIDAVDLDGDGESEWLFKAYKGCATGYRLYTNRLRTEVNSW